jgi:hypothetical protein
MTFSEALEQLKQGKKLKRRNWNGKNQFIFLIHGENIQTAYSAWMSDYWTDDDPDDDILSHFIGKSDISLPDLLAIKTTSNQLQLGWLASQADMLSNDWEVVEDEK